MVPWDPTKPKREERAKQRTYLKREAVSKTEPSPPESFPPNRVNLEDSVSNDSDAIGQIISHRKNMSRKEVIREENEYIDWYVDDKIEQLERLRLMWKAHAKEEIIAIRNFVVNREKEEKKLAANKANETKIKRTQNAERKKEALKPLAVSNPENSLDIWRLIVANGICVMNLRETNAYNKITSEIYPSMRYVQLTEANLDAYYKAKQSLKGASSRSRIDELFTSSPKEELPLLRARFLDSVHIWKLFSRKNRWKFTDFLNFCLTCKFALKTFLHGLWYESVGKGLSEASEEKNKTCGKYEDAFRIKKGENALLTPKVNWIERSRQYCLKCMTLVEHCKSNSTHVSAQICDRNPRLKVKGPYLIELSRKKPKNEQLEARQQRCKEEEMYAWPPRRFVVDRKGCMAMVWPQCIHYNYYNKTLYPYEKDAKNRRRREEEENADRLEKAKDIMGKTLKECNYGKKNKGEKRDESVQMITMSDMEDPSPYQNQQNMVGSLQGCSYNDNNAESIISEEEEEIDCINLD